MRLKLAYLMISFVVLLIGLTSCQRTVENFFGRQEIQGKFTLTPEGITITPKKALTAEKNNCTLVVEADQSKFPENKIDIYGELIDVNGNVYPLNPQGVGNRRILSLDFRFIKKGLSFRSVKLRSTAPIEIDNVAWWESDNK